jgi:hypothetical protein
MRCRRGVRAVRDLDMLSTAARVKLLPEYV